MAIDSIVAPEIVDEQLAALAPEALNPEAARLIIREQCKDRWDLKATEHYLRHHYDREPTLARQYGLQVIGELR